LVDRLLAQAARGACGRKPARPSPRIVADAQAFAETARRVGQADPDDVTDHLRSASKAFLAGDHASARAVFEAILPPVASVDIDLGQHELVEEVLGVDAQVCVAQYVASVYTTTPLPRRVEAVLRAIEDAQGVGTLLSPIKDMEDVTAGALPDLDLFLPRWIARLGRFRAPRDGWESEHERWLREAVGRRDGVDGLERLARATKRPQACLIREVGGRARSAVSAAPRVQNRTRPRERSARRAVAGVTRRAALLGVLRKLMHALVRETQETCGVAGLSRAVRGTRTSGARSLPRDETVKRRHLLRQGGDGHTAGHTGPIGAKVAPAADVHFLGIGMACACQCAHDATGENTETR
jgi:hypothetical protein